jgi:spermidine synthase / saccharopine dehydrogenase (NADP+, L-glutamate-forming)
MISHLPLSSHPSPKSVLVIGGGDGGVLREVLKHPTVQRAVLCDIDEAVPRVSKLYLPAMAAGFQDPRVEVFIGDGFQFLEERRGKGEFDVIITDSSDPSDPDTVEGSSMPADSLFQKGYFSLLRDNLAPGGTISTQGECVWLHLGLIEKLLKEMSEVFVADGRGGKVSYAQTSIPSYPSGSIGFLIATKDGSRDLTRSLPDRKLLGPTRYYNPRVHSAAFVLPEFARLRVDAALNNVSVGGESEGLQEKKILLLGSGFVAYPAAKYILRRKENKLTIGSSHFPFFLFAHHQ